MMKVYGIVVSIALLLLVFSFVTGMIIITGNHIQLPNWFSAVVLITAISGSIIIYKPEKIAERFSKKVKPT